MGTVASLLNDHVSFRCTSVDRIGVAGYIPGLQFEGGVVRFLLNRGYRIPSPAGLGHNHDRLGRDLAALVAERELPVVRFARRQNKEEVARPYQAGARAAGRPGIVLVGKAQERVGVWRGYKNTTSQFHSDSHPHFSFSRQSAVPDQWYFYLWDDEWGPALVKLCSAAPYGVWVNANGHEWVKRQLDKAGVGYRAIDNGLAAVDDPALAHRLCARLSAGHLRAAIERWMSWIPSPLTPADRCGGFAYDWSLRQVEVSDTAAFDRPANGRALFESAIREHLDLGRPDRVSLIFDRRIRTRGPHPTPGRFETAVVTRGVDPQIQIRYKSDKVKAYFKEQRALRVETTINNPDDFGVKRRLCADNWRALRSVGAAINARFLAAIGEGAPPAPDATTLAAVVLPSSTDDGLRAPGLRFGDPRVMALLASLASFTHVVGGLTNAGLRDLMSARWNPRYDSRKATYDLARLTRKGFIERIPATNTYRVTPEGRRIACFFTKLATRVVVPVLTELEINTRPRAPAPRPVIAAWRTYEREVEALITASGVVG
ncbi:MAG: hypothetical protein M3P34_02430 [Actinomycetota bacterium]|nr:hypothetical protein [Actinomycetota bacterium]